MSLIRRANRLSRIHTAVIGTAMFTALTGAALAQHHGVPGVVTTTQTDKPKFRARVDTRPERTEKSIDAVSGSTLSRNRPPRLMHGTIVTRMVDRLREVQALGARGPSGAEYKGSKEVAPPEEDSLNLSVYGEYSYLNSDDKRRLDTDSDTHSGSGGIDLTLGDTLVGLIYYYSHIDMNSPFLGSDTESDSNFISLYAAHPIQPWLSLGLTGGYGHTDVEVNLWARDGRRRTTTGSDTDSWTGSPFVSFSYASGDLYASLTTTYQYLHTDTDDSGQLNIQVATGYQIATWLTAEINGKFSQILHTTRSGEPEDDNWYGVGAKFKEHITPDLALYQGYNFNINDTFEEHMVTGGITYSF